MELISVTLKDFRRFEGSETLKTDGKLVAIIGANETGKSSLLEALSSLNDDEPLHRRITTWAKNTAETTVEAEFRLSAQDSAAMSGSTRLKVRKRADGKRTFELIPKIQRDWSLRDKIAEQLHALEKRPSFGAFAEDSLEDNFDLSKETGKLAKALEESLEDLPQATVDLIPQYVSHVRGSFKTIPRYFETMLSQLEKVHAIESLENPRVIAQRKAKSALPTFAFFDEDMRLLDDSYLVAEVAVDLPAALANLLALADVDISELQQAVKAGVVAEMRTLEDRANRTLAVKISEAWSQSDLIVRLTFDVGSLKILVQDTSHTYSDLSERSDGLRQFVALRAFMAQHHLKTPILLIDELEQRLHYDAQADLIQVLETQELAPKVIYTTHSAGSLPQDLGLGVHVVSARADAPHYSRIVNRFWEREEPGFSPLLIGLGASTLAFFPTRRALVAEGPSDMLLVPILLREAMGVTRLDFQLVPGLSSVSRTKLPALNANGAHVCYLVDGDSGGDAIVDLLRGAGVPDRLIFKLMVGRKLGHSIEDFVNPQVLVEAANRLGWTYTEGWTPITRHELSTTARAQSLEELFDARGQSRFSKVDLAYSVIDILDETNLSACDPRRIASLRELGRAVQVAFEEATV